MKRMGAPDFLYDREGHICMQDLQCHSGHVYSERNPSEFNGTYSQVNMYRTTVSVQFHSVVSIKKARPSTKSNPPNHMFEPKKC